MSNSKKKFTYILLSLAIVLSLLASIILIVATKKKSPPPRIPHSSPAEITALMTDPAIFEKGHTQYQLRCADCHGIDLSGTKKGPNLKDNDWLYSDEFNHMVNFISTGAPLRGMPSWGNQLLPEDIKAITAFILSVPSIDASAQ
jgi:mono/diheme cytochrome c family protein